MSCACSSAVAAPSPALRSRWRGGSPRCLSSARFFQPCARRRLPSRRKPEPMGLIGAPLSVFLGTGIRFGRRGFLHRDADQSDGRKVGRRESGIAEEVEIELARNEVIAGHRGPSKMRSAPRGGARDCGLGEGEAGPSVRSRRGTLSFLRSTFRATAGLRSPASARAGSRAGPEPRTAAGEHGEDPPLAGPALAVAPPLPCLSDFPRYPPLLCWCFSWRRFVHA